jgi:hypothetical protein
VFYSDLAFIDASSASNPIVKSEKEILDDACRTGGLVKVGCHVRSGAYLIEFNISTEEMHKLIAMVFEGTPDDLVGHAFCRMIARSRDRVLENYELSEVK